MATSSKHLRAMIAGAVVAALAFLPACTPWEEPDGAPNAGETGSPAPSVTVEPAADLSGISVSEGDVPEVSFEFPWTVASTQSEVLREGGTQLVREDSVVTIRYAGYNGRTGQRFDGNFDAESALTYPVNGFVPGFTRALVGKAVGSRVLMGIASEDGYASGNPDAGIEVGDSLVFVVDIVSANFSEATGEPAEPIEGLPVVTMTDDGPQIAIPEDTPAPAELKVATLIKGPGAAVTADAEVQVRFRSWLYDGAKLLDDAWAQPQAGVLQGLIEGWVQGLPGQTAGSRVLLVVPPALAYPDGRPTPEPAVPAGQTLVYVIDILDVQNP